MLTLKSTAAQKLKYFKSLDADELEEYISNYEEHTNQNLDVAYESPKIKIAEVLAACPNDKLMIVEEYLDDEEKSFEELENIESIMKNAGRDKTPLVTSKSPVKQIIAAIKKEARADLVDVVEFINKSFKGKYKFDAYSLRKDILRQLGTMTQKDLVTALRSNEILACTFSAPEKISQCDDIQDLILYFDYAFDEEDDADDVISELKRLTKLKVPRRTGDDVFWSDALIKVADKINFKVFKKLIVDKEAEIREREE